MRYIETIVLINLVIHLLFIKLSGYLLGIRIKKGMLILSIILDLIYTICYLKIPYYIEDYKYFFILLISFCPFCSKKIGSISAFFMYLLFNLGLGGMSELLYLINNYSILCLLLSLGIIYVVFILIAATRKKIDLKQLMYQIRITIDNKKYYLEAYLDTGNLLTYNLIPIILVSKEELLKKEVGFLKINSAFNNSEITIYKVDKFEIKLNKKFKERDVYLAYAELEYEILIGLKTMGG